MAYFFPHIDNFWHAQGVFTFFERRMPLYIMFLCNNTKYFKDKDILLIIFLHDRYSILLSFIMGNVQNEIKISHS